MSDQGETLSVDERLAAAERALLVLAGRAYDRVEYERNPAGQLAVRLHAPDIASIARRAARREPYGPLTGR